MVIHEGDHSAVMGIIDLCDDVPSGAACQHNRRSELGSLLRCQIVGDGGILFPHEDQRRDIVKRALLVDGFQQP